LVFGIGAPKSSSSSSLSEQVALIWHAPPISPSTIDAQPRNNAVPYTNLQLLRTIYLTEIPCSTSSHSVYASRRAETLSTHSTRLVEILDDERGVKTHYQN